MKVINGNQQKVLCQLFDRVLCVSVVSNVPALGIHPQLQTRLPPIYLRELFVTELIFSCQVYRTPTLFVPLFFFSNVEIYTVNLSPPALGFSRNKQIIKNLLLSPTQWWNIQKSAKQFVFAMEVPCSTDALYCS